MSSIRTIFGHSCRDKGERVHPRRHGTHEHVSPRLRPHPQSRPHHRRPRSLRRRPRPPHHGSHRLPQPRLPHLSRLHVMILKMPIKLIFITYNICIPSLDDDLALLPFYIAPSNRLKSTQIEASWHITFLVKILMKVSFRSWEILLKREGDIPQSST